MPTATVTLTGAQKASLVTEKDSHRQGRQEEASGLGRFSCLPPTGLPQAYGAGPYDPGSQGEGTHRRSKRGVPRARLAGQLQAGGSAVRLRHHRHH